MLFEVHKSLEQCVRAFWSIAPQICGQERRLLRFNGEAEVTVNPHVLAAGVVEMTSQTSARGQQLTSPLASPWSGKELFLNPTKLLAPCQRSQSM